MGNEDDKCMDILLSWGPFLKQVEDRVLAAGYAPGSFTHGVMMRVVARWLADELPSAAVVFMDMITSEEEKAKRRRGG